MRISPDGKLVSGGTGHGNGVKVWRLVDGEIVAWLKAQTLTRTTFEAVEWTPDGSHLVIGGDEGKDRGGAQDGIGHIRFYRTRDLGNPDIRPASRVQAFRQEYFHFTPDGGLMVSGHDIFGEGYFLRPDLFQPYERRNLLVEGVTFRGSPFWTVHPVFCANVTVRRINVLRGTTNDDGVDPESCRDVLIEDCRFDTKDDNIAIKAGRDQDAWGGRPCENIVVRRCTGVRSEANGFCIGSEMSGGVRNVFIEDCEVGDVQAALYVKSNTDRGGSVERVFKREVAVESCDRCVALETNHKGVDDTAHPSIYRDFVIEDVTCRAARKRGLYSVGIRRRPISGVTLRNVTIDRAAQAREVRYTNDLRLENVRINGETQRA